MIAIIHQRCSQRKVPPELVLYNISMDFMTCDAYSFIQRLGFLFLCFGGMLFYLQINLTFTSETHSFPMFHLVLGLIFRTIQHHPRETGLPRTNSAGEIYMPRAEHPLLRDSLIALGDIAPSCFLWRGFMVLLSKISDPICGSRRLYSSAINSCWCTLPQSWEAQGFETVRDNTRGWLHRQKGSYTLFF